MKKTLKRSIGKSINMFNHIGKIVERIIKIIIQSAVICCPVISILAIINSILGVNIRLSYYFILALVVTMSVSLLLCVLKWKQVTAKPVKASKKTVPAKTDRKTQRPVQRKRRRIS